MATADISALFVNSEPVTRSELRIENCGVRAEGGLTGFTIASFGGRFGGSFEPVPCPRTVD
jgi:hypothetical protein